MTIKEKIENNIVVVLMATSVAVGGVTFGVAKYYSDQRLSNVEHALNIKMKELESKLASIERDVPGIKHFDIRGLFVSDASSQPIDSGLSYFPEDKFYSIKSDEYWSYSKTTEIELLKQIADIDTGGGLLAILEEKSKNFPIHLWRSNDSFVMDNQGDKLTLFPHILLQRIPYSGVNELMGAGASFARWTEEEGDYEFDAEDMESTDDVDEFLKKANEVFYQDAAGTMFLFHNFLNFQSALASKNEAFKIKKLQKIGNVLYSQSMTEYSEVKINGISGSAFFQQELIIIATRDHLYSIKISLPSTEPSARVPVFANVNNWITSIKLVMN